MSIGQPKTPPRVVNAIGRQSFLGRGGTFALSISGIASVEAIIGLAKAVKRGSKLSSANFVKGNESENRNIPKVA